MDNNDDMHGQQGNVQLHHDNNRTTGAWIVMKAVGQGLGYIFTVSQ
jgi:hypothetical protein